MSAGVVIVEIMRTFRVSSVRAGDGKEEGVNLSNQFEFLSLTVLYSLPLSRTKLNLMLLKVESLSVISSRSSLTVSVNRFNPSPKIARKSCYWTFLRLR